MPTYEYECKTCGHSFEAFQAMSDEPLRDCPECGKAVRRLINGGTGVIFKGSGFYVTDKGKGSGKTGSLAKSDDVAAGETAGSATTVSSAGSGSAQSPAASSKTESGGGESASKQEGSGEKSKSTAQTA